MMTMYKLSETQHNNLKKQISVTVNWEITRKTKRSQMIYEIRYLKRVLQNSYQEKYYKVHIKKKKNEKQLFEQDTDYMNIKLYHSD